MSKGAYSNERNSFPFLMFGSNKGVCMPLSHFQVFPAGVTGLLPDKLLKAIIRELEEREILCKSSDGITERSLGRTFINIFRGETQEREERMRRAAPTTENDFQIGKNTSYICATNRSGISCHRAQTADQAQ